MIPLSDTIPHRNKPVITVSIIVVNFIVFFVELFHGPGLKDFIRQWGLTPLYVSNSLLAMPQRILPFFTSMFLHGGWLHLIGNNWYLWIFADNVEDKMGHFKFLLFYILCGLGAGALHYLTHSSSPLPTIGASGAISGILGAYFFMFPSSRIYTLIPIFFFWDIIEIPAFFYLGIWFFMQFLNGIASIGIDHFLGGVAWWAHIGGFLTGIALLRLFVPGFRRRFIL